MSYTAIAKLFEDSDIFNTIGGNKIHANTTPEFWTAVRNQVARINEEVHETSGASVVEDKVELLDGLVDVLVTTAGLARLLKGAGFDIDSACAAVAKNNLDKFFTDPSEAMLHEQMYVKLGQQVTVQQVIQDGVPYYVLKRASDNKIMKPFNHPKVELKDFV